MGFVVVVVVVCMGYIFAFAIFTDSLCSDIRFQSLFCCVIIITSFYFSYFSKQDIIAYIFSQVMSNTVDELHVGNCYR